MWWVISINNKNSMKGVFKIHILIPVRQQGLELSWLLISFILWRYDQWLDTDYCVCRWAHQCMLSLNCMTHWPRSNLNSVVSAIQRPKRRYGRVLVRIFNKSIFLIIHVQYSSCMWLKWVSWYFFTSRLNLPYCLINVHSWM